MGWLLIDDENSIERIKNNITHFWSDHQSDLNILLNKESTKDEMNLCLNNIKNSTTELGRAIRKHLNSMLKEMDQTLLYCKNVNDGIIKLVFEENINKIKTIKNGILCLKKAIYTIIKAK